MKQDYEHSMLYRRLNHLLSLTRMVHMSDLREMRCPKGIFVKQNWPQGVLNVVKSYKLAFMGKVQNPLLMSILLTFEMVPRFDTISWKV